MSNYIPGIHHRKSIRLKGYDYSQAGLYFITICCHGRVCHFGEVKQGEMVLNNAGLKARECWMEIPDHFPNVVLHEYVVMPDHIHGIVEITAPAGANDHSPDLNDKVPETQNDSLGNAAGTMDFLHLNGSHGANHDSPLRSPSKTIGSVVRGFKIGVTKWMRQNTDVHHVWQRNYHERIIRNVQSYYNITNYIKNNPAQWNRDKFHR